MEAAWLVYLAEHDTERWLQGLTRHSVAVVRDLAVAALAGSTTIEHALEAVLEHSAFCLPRQPAPPRRVLGDQVEETTTTPAAA